jgi:hypothetical protein
MHHFKGIAIAKTEMSFAQQLCKRQETRSGSHMELI